jgi:hypothetical protein
MSIKRHKPEEIVPKLPQLDVTPRIADTGSRCSPCNPAQSLIRLITALGGFFFRGLPKIQDLDLKNGTSSSVSWSSSRRLGSIFSTASSAAHRRSSKVDMSAFHALNCILCLVHRLRKPPGEGSAPCRRACLMAFMITAAENPGA